MIGLGLAVIERSLEDGDFFQRGEGAAAACPLLVATGQLAQVAPDAQQLLQQLVALCNRKVHRLGSDPQGGVLQGVIALCKVAVRQLQLLDTGGKADAFSLQLCDRGGQGSQGLREAAHAAHLTIDQLHGGR